MVRIVVFFFSCWPGAQSVLCRRQCDSPPRTAYARAVASSVIYPLERATSIRASVQLSKQHNWHTNGIGELRSRSNRSSSITSCSTTRAFLGFLAYLLTKHSDQCGALLPTSALFLQQSAQRLARCSCNAYVPNIKAVFSTSAHTQSSVCSLHRLLLLLQLVLLLPVRMQHVRKHAREKT
jgi:hypothetical protein